MKITPFVDWLIFPSTWYLFVFDSISNYHRRTVEREWDVKYCMEWLVNQHWNTTLAPICFLGHHHVGLCRWHPLFPLGLHACNCIPISLVRHYLACMHMCGCLVTWNYIWIEYNNKLVITQLHKEEGGKKEWRLVERRQWTTMIGWLF